MRKKSFKKISLFAVTTAAAVATVPAVANTVDSTDNTVKEDNDVQKGKEVSEQKEFTNKNVASSKIARILLEGVLNDKLNYEIGTRDEDGNFIPFSSGEARAVNPLHDVNNVRQGLIRDAVESDDWSDYHKFQAQQKPAHYNVDKEGNVVKNKEYYIQFINSTYSNYKAADTDEEKERYKERLDEQLQEFKEAPSSPAGVPYLVGINGNEERAKEFGVPVASDTWFDSAYNDPDVIQNGYAGDRMWYENPLYEENPMVLEKVVEDTEEHGTSEQLEFIKENLKEQQKTFTTNKIKEILLDSLSNDTLNYKVGTTDEDGEFVPYDAEEARATNPLHDVNNVRQGLIKDAVDRDDWSDYHKFQAKQYPAWYNVDENGIATKNKEYYAHLVESSYQAMITAENKEKAEIWERSLMKRVEQFNNAPSAEGDLVPYIPRVSPSSDSDDNPYDIEPASREWFDSKYNEPKVRSQGQFESRMWYENPMYKENPTLVDKIKQAREAYEAEKEKEKEE